MPRPSINDRVQETTTTTGTGTYTFAGAKTGYRTFTSVFADALTTYYAATDGTAWEVGIGTMGGTGTTLTRDRIIASSNAGAAVSWSSGSKDIWCNAPAELIAGLRTMDGYGCVVSNNVTDATNDLDFAVGRWRADDDTGDLELTAAITKRADATFVVGTNQGMLDEGTLTNSSFHGYLIKRLDTAVVDVLLSRNPGRTMTFTVTIATPGVVTAVDHGLTEGSSFVPTTTGALPTGMTASTRYYVLSTSLTADTFRFAATQGGAAINTSVSQSGVHTLVSDPVMPASYTKKRRIFSILRESATLIGITQTDDKFYRNTMVNAWAVVSPGSSAVTRDAKTPRGIRSAVVLYGRYDADAGQHALVTDLRNTASTPQADHNQWVGSGAGYINTAQTDIFTDFSGQVRTQTASPVTEWSVQCRGWIDSRGRL